MLICVAEIQSLKNALREYEDEEERKNQVLQSQSNISEECQVFEVQQHEDCIPQLLQKIDNETCADTNLAIEDKMR